MAGVCCTTLCPLREIRAAIGFSATTQSIWSIADPKDWPGDPIADRGLLFDPPVENGGPAGAAARPGKTSLSGAFDPAFALTV